MRKKELENKLKELEYSLNNHTILLNREFISQKDFELIYDLLNGWGNGLVIETEKLKSSLNYQLELLGIDLKCCIGELESTNKMLLDRIEHLERELSECQKIINKIIKK